MPQINQLPLLSPLTSSDQFPVYSSANGDARRVSANELLTFIENNITGGGGGGGGGPGDFVEIVSLQAASGFNIVLPSNNNNMWVVLLPAGAFAAGTLTLPPIASLANTQEIQFNTTNSITAFTINGNGAGLGVVPNTLGTGGFFTLRYSQTLNVWYRVA